MAERPSGGSNHSTTLADANLVPGTSANDGEGHSSYGASPETSEDRESIFKVTLAPPESNSTCRKIIRKSLERRGITGHAANVCLQSWKPNTLKQYSGYLMKWSTFCDERQVDTFAPSEVDVVNWLICTKTTI